MSGYGIGQQVANGILTKQYMQNHDAYQAGRSLAPMVSALASAVPTVNKAVSGLGSVAAAAAAPHMAQTGANVLGASRTVGNGLVAATQTPFQAAAMSQPAGQDNFAAQASAHNAAQNERRMGLLRQFQARQNPYDAKNPLLMNQLGQAAGTLGEQYTLARQGMAEDVASRGISTNSGLLSRMQGLSRLNEAADKGAAFNNANAQNYQRAASWQDARDQQAQELERLLMAGDSQGFNQQMQAAQYADERARNSLFDPLKANGLSLANQEASIRNQYLAPTLAEGLRQQQYQTQGMGLDNSFARDTYAPRVSATNAGYGLQAKDAQYTGQVMDDAYASYMSPNQQAQRRLANDPLYQGFKTALDWPVTSGKATAPIFGHFLGLGG